MLLEIPLEMPLEIPLEIPSEIPMEMPLGILVPFRDTCGDAVSRLDIRREAPYGLLEAYPQRCF